MDSSQKTDKLCIFRETFNSEAEVRRNGGVPTNVVFGNGVASLTLGRIDYGIKGGNNTSFSIRIVGTLPWSGAFLYFFNNKGNTIRIFSNSGTCTGTFDYCYIDGVYTAVGAPITSIKHDMVFMFSSLKTFKSGFSVGGSYMGTGTTSTFELFEIYQGTLTANEVKNLYENKRYKDVQPISHGEQLGPELIPSSWADNPITWWNGVGVDWSADGTSLVSAVGNVGHITKDNFFTIGRRYKITMSGVVAVGSVYLPYDIVNGYNTLQGGVGAFTTTSYQLAGAVMMYISASNFTGTITALSIKEVLVNSTKEILNVCAYDGAIRNKYSGDTINGNLVPAVILTSVSVVKENDAYAMRFNGTTSKIDCGSYDTLVGDKTFVFWINPFKFITNNYILFNGKTQLAVQVTSPTILFTSNNWSNMATSAASIVIRKKWQSIVVTRTSIGITNIYLNGVLSGTANQNSGTPVAGTSNIFIGWGNDYYNGLIPSVRIIDGILTPQEISEIYSAEKIKYGL